MHGARGSDVTGASYVYLHAWQWLSTGGGLDVRGGHAGFEVAVVKGDVARAIVAVSGVDGTGKPRGARPSVELGGLSGQHALSRAPLPRGGQPRRGLAARA